MNARACWSLALVLACACDGEGGNPGSTLLPPPDVIVNGDTFADRAHTAWAGAPSASVGESSLDILAKINSSVAVDVPGKLTGLPDTMKVVDLNAEKYAGFLMGTEEAGLADALRADGVKVVILHRALRESFDRDRHLLSRLYHHDALERFQLVRVEAGAWIYIVNDGSIRFDPAVADASMRWLRAKLSGENPAPFTPLKAERGEWTLITSLRGHGQELAFSLAQAQTLDVALSEAAIDLEAMHRRQREILGFPRLRQQMKDLTIEIHRVKERALVVPRSDDALKDTFEMGIDGAILLDRVGDKKQSGAWPGSVAVSRGITTTDEFLRALAREFKWDSNRPWRDDEDVSLELVRTVDYREVPGSLPVAMYRGTTQMPLEAVNLTTVKASIIYAGEWWLANLQPDGTVTYKFWPEEDRYSEEYNHVRHELATWNLWQAWTLDPRPDFMEGAIRAQNWTLRSLVRRDGSNLEAWEKDIVEKSPLKEEIEREGMAYFTYADNTKLGSAVVGLFGMIEVARSTNDHSNDDLMRKLGRYIMVSQLPEGNFRPYWVKPGHKYEHEKNDIVPGEAALALVYLSEYFNDPQYLAPLDKFFEYYKPWFTSRAEKRNDRAPWPAYLYDNDTRLDLVQFGPWTVMAANAYTRNKPERTDIVDFGLELGKWMVDAYEYTSERAPYPDYVGGYYKFKGELPAMQAFCYGEGTAAAYTMALRARPDQAAYFEKATRETVRLAMQMQHDRLDSLYYSRPELAEGGVRYALNEPKVRVDYTYHAQSTMFQWYSAAKSDPNLPDTAKAEPDAQAAAFFKLQDLPTFRDPGAPVRTSVAAAGTAAAPLTVAPAASAKGDDDGGD